MKFKLKKSRTSNARFVKWSDGSLSLLLGDELFEIQTKSIEKEQQYLVAAHNDTILRTQTKLAKVMTFKPQDTNSLTHKKLTFAIANQNKKVNKAKQIDVAENPELKTQLAIKV